MFTKEFNIPKKTLICLLETNFNMGKNSHIGNLAVKIVELYFLSLDPEAIFSTGKNGADLEVTYLQKIEKFEIKGTADGTIAWNKLKVSSQQCHDALVNGMSIIRVTNVGKENPTIHILKHNEDFRLIPEARWRLSRIK
ncbi:MAG TPA: hypothetical protein VF465_06565 [Flavobacterium sp.]|uniref:hypothetical protein n=1 Tax=Flavobacterium sp. TaxID=239 RepID=UPI002ED01AA5